jgi:hypothetical protein
LRRLFGRCRCGIGRGGVGREEEHRS